MFNIYLIFPSYLLDDIWSFKENF